MNRVSAATLAASLLPASPAVAHADVTVAVRPEIGVQAGDETYELSAPVAGTPYPSEARLLGSSSSHVDDHVLRHKLSQADPLGLGFALSAAPTLQVARGVDVGFDVSVQYLTSVSGTLSQHYYADDPYLPGDQTQVEIPDADFGFHAIRGRLMAFVQAEL